MLRGLQEVELVAVIAVACAHEQEQRDGGAGDEPDGALEPGDLTPGGSALDSTRLGDRHAPMGCQTVLNSIKAVMSYGLCADAANQSPARAATTRFTFSAARRSTSARPSAGTPVSSIAFTSMWPASHGTSS